MKAAFLDPFEILEIFNKSQEQGDTERQLAYGLLLSSLFHQILPSNSLTSHWEFLFEDQKIRAFNNFLVLEEDDSDNMHIPFELLITPGLRCSVIFPPDAKDLPIRQVFEDKLQAILSSYNTESTSPVVNNNQVIH